MNVDDYAELLSHDVSEGMKVYWFETLERVHIAAVTSILRNSRWLSAVLLTVPDRNALSFAAAFRGLLESAADTATALIGIPRTLANHYSTISDALSGLATTLVMSSELEDELIHYSHGRYVEKSEQGSTPQSHRARFAKEYRTAFEGLNANDVAQCYRFLCDLTHPGASSVLMWLATVDQKGSELVLSAKQDEAIIANFLKEYNTVLSDALALAFNAPLLALMTLNYFPIERLHTPKLLNHHLDGIVAWAEYRNELESKGASLQAVSR